MIIATIEAELAELEAWHQAIQRQDKDYKLLIQRMIRDGRLSMDCDPNTESGRQAAMNKINQLKAWLKSEEEAK